MVLQFDNIERSQTKRPGTVPIMAPKPSTPESVRRHITFKSTTTSGGEVLIPLDSDLFSAVSVGAAVCCFVSVCASLPKPRCWLGVMSATRDATVDSIEGGFELGVDVGVVVLVLIPALVGVSNLSSSKIKSCFMPPIIMRPWMRWSRSTCKHSGGPENTVPVVVPDA